MTLQSFNSFLLTTIVKNFRLGSDPKSLVKRHQTLSIIYTNFSLVLMIAFYELTSIMLGIPYHHLLDMIAPFIIVVFALLRNGKNDLAAALTMLWSHGTNAYVSHYCHSSIGALVVIFIYPNFGFFMSSSNKLEFANMGLCMLQILGQVRRFMKTFYVTMSPEQDIEINHLIAVAIPCFIFLAFTIIAHKSVEKSLWQATSTTQEKIEKINHEIMQAVESKDAFISSLSHEIRNPLNAMNGSIDYLLQVVRDRQLLQVLHNAKISGETLLNLFTNLLDAAKLKSEKMELFYDDTNIYDKLEKVLVINSENIKQKRIFVDAFINPKIPQVIQSDSARLLQILLNLMSNAVKFTPEGGKINICVTACHKDSTKEQLESRLAVPILDNPSTRPIEKDRIASNGFNHEANDDSFLTEEFTPEESKRRCKNLKHIKPFEVKTIQEINSDQSLIYCENQPWKIQKIDVSSDGQDDMLGQGDLSNYYLKIQITDTGCGIAEENISKLFEMFTQAHNRVTSSHGGTGLGLWLCKQLCQKMGGDIKLYSKLNEGTSFVFYLPIAGLSHFSHTESTQESERGASQFPEKTSCLVVDDFSYNRDLYKLLLEREGVQVVVASDGEEAISKYIANLGKLDFILMDVQMPRMDGFTATRKIRELEAERKLKRVDIYFVSGEYYNEEEVRASFRAQQGEDCQKLGIQCLKKPIDIEVIGRVAAKYTVRTTRKTH